MTSEQARDPCGAQRPVTLHGGKRACGKEVTPQAHRHSPNHRPPAGKGFGMRHPARKEVLVQARVTVQDRYGKAWISGLKFGAKARIRLKPQGQCREAGLRLRLGSNRLKFSGLAG
jgi:hypothetical protein